MQPGLAVLSALVTYFFISPLDHDSMAKEDAAVRAPTPRPDSALIKYMLDSFENI
jgi:hypothetical protein